MHHDDAALLRRARIRRRVTLEVVHGAGPEDPAPPPGDSGQVAYRGDGHTDYACGRCGLLVAIGVQEEALPSLVFACGCGALNRSSSRHW